MSEERDDAAQAPAETPPVEEAPPDPAEGFLCIAREVLVEGVPPYDLREAYRLIEERVRAQGE